MKKIDKEYISEVYKWTTKKEKLHLSTKIEKLLFQKNISLKKGQIWWFNVWINVWKEIWKSSPFLRPCLIVSNNCWIWLIWVFPIYWWLKYDNKHIYKFNDYKKYWLNKESVVLLNHFKTISIKRLVKKINDKSWLPLVYKKELDILLEKFKNLI